MSHPGRILFGDDHLLIVHKLSGELAVAAEEKQRGGSGKESLYDFLRKDYPGLRVVHRLDYATSGALVFARSAEALKAIRDAKFMGWRKTYHALIAGNIREKNGTIRKDLPARTQELLVPAVTHYRVLAVFPGVSYVEACIETGRKHQIRQHFAAIGHPLLLDPLYGDKKADVAFQRKFRYRRFFLHAAELSFPHPVTGEEISIKAPLPPAFEDVLKTLNGK
jgi:RluA family pseudouridine synthase